jgi:hypothetical protein
VVTVFEPDEMAAALPAAGSTCFILTNTRSLPEADAVALNTRIGRILFELADRLEAPIDVVSRSDSTLRGHVIAEVRGLDAVRREVTGRGFDGVQGRCPADPQGLPDPGGPADRPLMVVPPSAPVQAIGDRDSSWRTAGRISLHAEAALPAHIGCPLVGTTRSHSSPLAAPRRPPPSSGGSARLLRRRGRSGARLGAGITAPRRWPADGRSLRVR